MRPCVYGAAAGRDAERRRVARERPPIKRWRAGAVRPRLRARTDAACVVSGLRARCGLTRWRRDGTVVQPLDKGPRTR